MKLMRCFVAAAVMACVSPAVGQDSMGSARESYPGSVFVKPAGGNSPISPESDPEITSDVGLFRNKGFREPNWQTHTAQVEDVLKEVVLPDWRGRTGETKDPELPSIDVAAEQVLGSGFSDLLVMSRLPGDCGPTGCLFQIYSFVNEVWVKRFEFRTVAFAWKEDPSGDVVVAQVGGMWVPSRTHIWKDGKLQ